jgi:hypothetical protein
VTDRTPYGFTNGKPVLAIGDQMRISIELLRDVCDEIDQRTRLVEVMDVRIEPDGTKTLFLRTVIED